MYEIGIGIIECDAFFSECQIKTVACGNIVKAAEFVDNRAVDFHVLFLKELAQDVFAHGSFLAFVATQQCADFAFCLGGIGILYPLGLDMLRT